MLPLAAISCRHVARCCRRFSSATPPIDYAAIRCRLRHAADSQDYIIATRAYAMLAAILQIRR